jgi:hypothetical protein
MYEKEEISLSGDPLPQPFALYLDISLAANSRNSGYRSMYMSLLHYVRPFLELGTCKEYSMARKATGNTTTRKKKVETTIQPSAVEVASGAPKDEKPVHAIPGSRTVNLEEKIRQRAYELYLQRRATAGSVNGDENQDWLVAEREILSLHGGQEQHSA